MFFRKDQPKRNFIGVAIATLLSGAFIIVLGLVELGFNLWDKGTFAGPTFKIVGGLVVMALGYIQLELELLRIDKK